MVWWQKGIRGVACDECVQGGKPTEKASPLPQEQPKRLVLSDDQAKARCATPSADGIYRVEYDSIQDAVTDALTDYAQNLHNRTQVNLTQNNGLSGGDKWGNYFTHAKLLDQIGNPDQKLIQAVKDMRDEIVKDLNMPSRPRRKIRRGQDWGDELDADRVLHRDPTPWERTDKTQAPTHNVTIACNVSVSCRVLPAQLLYRGAAALALADLLTEQGCNVGITIFKVVERATSDVHLGLAKCVVKAPNMPMDVGALAFAMCEIAFCRLVMVCAEARRFPGTLAGNFGYSASLPAADRAGMDYVIDNEILSKEAAIQWLREQQNKEN